MCHFFTNHAKKSLSRNNALLLRFYLYNIRSEDLPSDKCFLIWDIWKMLINNSISCFEAGANIAIDEQLLQAKSCCSVTQYVPNKLNKNGIMF